MFPSFGWRESGRGRTTKAALLAVGRKRRVRPDQSRYSDAAYRFGVDLRPAGFGGNGRARSAQRIASKPDREASALGSLRR
jgi:hypothetical protein